MRDDSASEKDMPDYLRDGIAAIKQGDQEGITAFVEAITPHIRQVAVNLLHRNDAAADDLVQEALIRIVTKIDLYDESRPFDAWASAIVDHLYIDDVRKRKPLYSRSRHEEETGGRERNGGAIPALDHEDTRTLRPLDAAIYHETKRGISDAIAKARAGSEDGYRTWEAITSGQRSIQDIARETDRTDNAVRKQKSLFRMKIKEFAEGNGTLAKPSHGK